MKRLILFIIFIFLSIFTISCKDDSFNHYIDDSYEWFDNEFVGVMYTIEYKTNDTLEINNFINEYVYSYVTDIYSDTSIYVDSSIYNESLNNYIMCLKSKEIVKQITAEYEYRYLSVTMKRPASYGLTGHNQIDFKELDNISIEPGIYKTYDELLNVTNDSSILELYNEAYFSNNILIKTKIFTFTSGSIRKELVSSYYKDDKIYLFTKTFIPQIGTCDMKYLSFTIGYSKSDITINNSLEFIID